MSLKWFVSLLFGGAFYYLFLILDIHFWTGINMNMCMSIHWSYSYKWQGILICIFNWIKVVKLNLTTFFEIIGRCHKKRAQDRNMDTCMQGNEKSENYSNKLFTTRKSLIESFLSFKSQLSLNCFVLEDTYIERRVFKLFATENERCKKQKILIRCTAYKI